MKKMVLTGILLIALACVGSASAFGPISFDHDGQLVVTYKSSSADYNNEFGVLTPGPLSLGMSQDVSPPHIYTEAGTCTAGEVVVLYITTPRIEINQWITIPRLTYKSDRTAWDSFNHAEVTKNPDGSYEVGFEDGFLGGDQDFNDVVLTVSCMENEIPVPEFPIIALPAGLIIGLLGAVFYIRSTKEE